ncbi:phosphatidylinositol 4-kinase gamma 4-like [Raphanus sativus]|uniref:1-phosphatidylinositol 4-kinase n=1 Tax=Raphanus sativus TaxID=3726 RepID=A0A9W3D9E5_RAPSA|nr:phosphatidylinositol 4-kinase gamma 4-like [Raphanus sativus]
MRGFSIAKGILIICGVPDDGAHVTADVTCDRALNHLLVLVDPERLGVLLDGFDVGVGTEEDVIELRLLLVETLITKKKKGGDFVDFEILYECEKLEDQRLINDICRNGDSVLHLIVKRSAKVRAKPVDKSFELSIVAPPQARVVTQRKQFSVEPLIVNPKVKLSPVVKDMISSASDGLRSENPLVRSREGTGGAYFMQASSGNK